jgi:hypothetical protein
MPLDQITGTISRIFKRICDDETEQSRTWWIAGLEVASRRPEDRISVKGTAHPDDFREGRSYVFHGKFEEQNPKYPGKTFSFEVVVPHEPNTRRGTMLYLADTCPGIGPAIACQLFDLFSRNGESAISVLRSDPERAAAAIPRLTLENARVASQILKADAALQDTKIELREIFAGTGIPRAAIDACVRRWGPLAPRRIRRDPFTLLVSNIPGCGYARCDRLHSDFGLPADAMKRVIACAWHGIREDREGHTWYRMEVMKEKCKREVGGTNIEAPYKQDRKDSKLIRALRIGKRAGTFAMRKDERGIWWVADGQKARNEKLLAGYVAGLLADPVTLPRFTEPLPGECGDVGKCGKCNGRGMVEIVPSGPMKDGWIVCPDCRGMDAEFADDPGEPLPDIERLIEIGRETGICQRCGHELTNPLSMAAGVGEYCARVWGVAYGKSPVTEVAMAGGVL